jgi:hypothetical protein
MSRKIWRGIGRICEYTWYDPVIISMVVSVMSLVLSILSFSTNSSSSGYHEFFNVGHDEANQLLNLSLLGDHDRDVSLFLGGAGDARHFYGQLAHLGIGERILLNQARRAGVDEESAQPKRKFHFTLNDHKASTLARDIVLFVLLDELATSKDELSSSERTKLYAVVFFIFIGVIMPGFAFDRLNQTIDMLVRKLNGKETVLPWLRVYEPYRAELIRALRSWRSDALVKMYSTEDIISTAQAGLLETGLKAITLYGLDPRKAPPGCQKEYDDFLEAIFLLPPKSMLKEYDPDLQRLLDTDEPPDDEQRKKYLCEHWHPNPTLLDEDWHVKAQTEPDVAFDPFKLATQFQEVLLVDERFSSTKLKKKKNKLFDYVAAFFSLVVQALRRSRDRLCVELIVDDLAAAMDNVRRSLIEGRDQTAPTVFDVVHLSNVPDYIGGSFVTFVYGLKLLNNATTAKITATCLRNTGLWKSHEQFQSEYMIVNDFDTLFKLTQAQFMNRADERDSFFPMSGYMDWRRARMEAFPYELLLPRAELTRWLFAHFFKMALPRGRSVRDHNFDHFLFPTLNLTNFFHLLVHLHDIGYPAHWLGEVLAKILEGQVVTTARPPKTLPLDVQEAVTRRYPAARVNTNPYMAEMSTLTVLYARILPFCPITTASLPSPASIYSYSIRMREVETPPPGETYAQALILIFFRLDLHMACKARAEEMYSLLDMSPEKNDRRFDTTAAKAFREDGCIVVTAFKWSGPDANDRRATFWMREDVVDRMTKAGEPWVCGLWRVDDWMPVTWVPEKVDLRTVIKGGKWKDA